MLLTDNDLYKFTMQQAILHHYPGVEVEYHFFSRDNRDYTPYIDLIRHRIMEMSRIKLISEEYEFLRNIRYLKKDYVDFLRFFRYAPEDYVTIDIIDGKLDIRIHGPWLMTVLFEVPILAIISEVVSEPYIESEQWKPFYEEIEYTLRNEIKKVKEFNKEYGCIFKFLDFGTRRRASFIWQKFMLKILKEELPKNLIGTSNVYFAWLHGLIPQGTHAHEWFMAHQALVRLKDSQLEALEVWIKEYRGDLGIALSDTITTDAFIKDFDLYLAKLYDGVRLDSGDIYESAAKIIQHYKDLHINPKTKTIVISDSLNFDKALEFIADFHNDINVRCGIGTFLTNNIPSQKAPNIVIKMVECNGMPVAKISDNPGKSICTDESYLSYLKSQFNC